MFANSWSSRLPLLLLAGGAGYLTHLGFAPYYYNSLFYLGLFIYIFTLQIKATNRRASYLIPYIWDLVFSFSTLYWLTNAMTFFGDVGMGLAIVVLFAVAMLLALRSVIIVFLWRARNKNFIWLPLLISAVTYLWYVVVGSFDWLNFAYSNHNNLGVFLAPLGGVYLVQFFQLAFITFIYTLVHKALVRRLVQPSLHLYQQQPARELKVTHLSETLILFILSLIFVVAHFTTIQWTERKEKTQSVALVQPNLAIHDKNDLTKFYDNLQVYLNLIQQQLQQAKNSKHSNPNTSEVNYSLAEDSFATDNSVVSSNPQESNLGKTTIPKLWIMPEGALMEWYTGNANGKLEVGLSNIYNQLLPYNADILIGVPSIKFNRNQTTTYSGQEQSSLPRYTAYNSLIALSKPSNLIGVIQATDTSLLFNDTNEVLIQKYNKQKLVPFGEYLPFAQWLGKLGILNFAEIAQGSYTPGLAQQPNLQSQNSQIVPLICFDGVFAEQLREQFSPQSQVIVNVSNDMWFGQNTGPQQHLNIARYRSLEMQRYTLRATNNGVTAIIDQLGNVTSILPRNQAAVLVGNYYNYEGTTPYQQFGEWINFALALAYILFFFLIKGLVTIGLRKKEKPFNLR